MNALDANKKMTISDIARIAGVARSTVSEVVNGNLKGRVSEKTYRLVSRIIQQYNYVPSPSAKALITKKTRQLGYLVSATATLGIGNSFFAAILAGVERGCAEKGYRCLVNRFDLACLENFILPSELRQPSVDGLVIAGVIGESSELLKALGIPIGVVGVSSVEEFFHINRDSIATFVGGLKYLAEHGHINILFPWFNQLEFAELREAVDIYNKDAATKILPVFWQDSANKDEFTRGVEIAESVLAGANTHCTAIVANDQICCGFIQKMILAGKNIPDDCSVIATSDTPLCRWNSIPVSAFNAVPDEHGYILGKALIDLLEKQKTREEVKAELKKYHVAEPCIVRKSSGKAPAAVKKEI